MKPKLDDVVQGLGRIGLFRLQVVGFGFRVGVVAPANGGAGHRLSIRRDQAFRTLPKPKHETLKSELLTRNPKLES